MVGRYGTDELNRFLLTAVLVMILGNVFARNRLVFWLEAICLILCYFRMFSRNLPARQRENQVFLRVWRPITQWFSFQRTRFRDRKLYRYFKCPHCGLRLRAPKGRGKIQVTCQKCHTEFIKRV